MALCGKQFNSFSYDVEKDIDSKIAIVPWDFIFAVQKYLPKDMSPCNFFIIRLVFTEIN